MIIRKIDYTYYNKTILKVKSENFMNEENKNKSCPNKIIPSDHLPSNVIFEIKNK